MKIHEHQAVRVEEEKNFVQPIDDLRCFIRTRRFEVALFQRAKRSRIDENADETLRGRNERFLSCRAARQHTDIGCMLEQFEHGVFVSLWLLNVELYVPV